MERDPRYLRDVVYRSELIAQITRAVFADETSLGEFANSLSSTEAAALYQLLHARGCRFDTRALSTWRKEKRDG